MHFSNGIITPLILEPIRYHFANYSESFGFKWDEDEKVRSIDIGEAFDFNKVALQQKPRIVVTRGPYQISKTGLSDNMMSAKGIGETLGLQHKTNLLFYNGSAMITVEARNKGTCEIVADMVTHIVAWTRPVLCDVLGFKEFGLPMRVGDCSVLVDEDPGVPKFQVQIELPWIREEAWNFQTDGIALKKMLLSISPYPVTP